MLHSTTDKVKFIERVFGRGIIGKNHKDITVRCPILSCPSRKDGAKKKLAIRIEDDACHCWVCGWASKTMAPLLIKHVGRAEFNEYRSAFNPQAFIGAAEAPAVEQRLGLPPGYCFLMSCPKNDPMALAAWSYLLKRGLDESHVWKFKLGVSYDQRWKNRIISLSADAAGQLNFYIGRTFLKNVRPKYDIPDGVKSVDIIWNENNIDWSRRLTLCEGVFDLMKCGENATCMLGSNLSENSLLFNQILLHSTPIALALDSDMQLKKLAYARKFAEYDISVDIVDLGGSHDPGEMTQQEFLERLDAAKPYNWTESLKLKLSSI